MVNIQSVVHITEQTVQSFDSIDSYYAAVHNGSSASWRTKQQKLRRMFVYAEQGLATKYNIPLATLNNVCFLFGTTSNAIRRMQDVHTRELVCDLNHKIVVQLRTTHDRCDVITTVYRPFDHETLTSAFTFVGATPSDIEL
jgi:hypothetical protein